MPASGVITWLKVSQARIRLVWHEATSRLFEAGYTIVEVQQFTLHEDWNVLKRYTHLRPGDVRIDSGL